SSSESSSSYSPSSPGLGSALGSGDSSLSLEKKSVSVSRSKSKSLPSQPESRTTAATAAPKGARGVDGISRMGGFRFGERREQRKAPAGDTRNLASSPGSGHRTGTFAFPQRLRVDHPTGGACTAGSGPHLGRTSRSGRRPPTGTVFC